MADARPRFITLNPRDNVAVATGDVSPGMSIGNGIEARDAIPAGHKVAIKPIDSGQAVIKYGQAIGRATRPVKPGSHVHLDNLKMADIDQAYSPGADAEETVFVAEQPRAFFKGYVRPDGRVGTRNFVGVIATVSCSSSVTRFIADAVSHKLLSGFANVDGIVALGHGSGCCMAPGSEGLQLLQKTIAGYAQHPNFGGVLLVGLGCEVNLAEDLMQATGLEPHATLHTLVIQDAGGTRETISRGVDAISEMLPEVNKAVRTDVSAARLVVGLECGGSDGYSGITANPALGVAVDMLVRHGGTAILSETPEIYGAEHLLVQRAADRQVGRQLLERIAWWKQYTRRHGARLNNNPTPGNKAGGITTIIEKSMGAITKAGTTNLNAFYRYADQVTRPGLVFMDTPGYDVVSITGMIAGGANLVCFTTGRGTVCGFRPVPTLKLASNSRLYEAMPDDMDIDCGKVVDGRATLDEMGQEIFDSILESASGKPTKSETLGFGGNEFVPWHLGAVL